MTDTANLGMPFIDGSQAQKHVTHNEALRILDAVVQIGVLDRTRTAPPSSPAEGDRHVAAVGATGAWAGQANTIATCEDAAWRFVVPKLGWSAWCEADGALIVYDGSAWIELATGGGSSADTLAQLGINTAASAPNLLTVQSNASLFNAIAVADGGTGDARLQVSKETGSHTASVVFSNNFSGRAEFGLVGSDAFKLKVSPDGSTFVEAFTIDQTSGSLALPRGFALTGVISPAQITSDQNNYNPTGIADASVVQMSSDASRNISGLASGAEGRIVSVLNVGSQPIVFLDESASSSAANRLTLGADLSLAAKQALILRYDGTASHWFAMARPGSGSGTSGALLAASNLSDVANKTTGRTNLGVAIGSNVQAWDADLDAVAALVSNGIVARTGTGAVAVRTVTGPAAGLTVTNGDGVSGNPTLALANDLNAIEALSSTGIARRTGTDAWSVGASVANYELATMANTTIKGNVSGSTAAPSDLTATQVTAVLNAMVGDSGSGGAKGLVPAAGAGDAAAGKFLKADGTFAVPPGTGGGGALSDTDRQNILLERIYQSKVIGGFRRFINAFADSYKASDGINSGSSSNYTVTTASGFVAPTVGLGSSTSYANTGGSGNRSASISVSASAGFAAGAGSPSALVDGTQTNSYYLTSASCTGFWVYDFGAGASKYIDEFKQYHHAADASSTGQWDFAGSNDNVTYTALHTGTFTLLAATNTLTLTPPAAGFRYFRLRMVSGTVGAEQPWRRETEFKIDNYSVGAANNMTLVTTSQTADATVSHGRVLIEFDNTAAPTLNTDLTVELTCNGGANWSSASLSSASTNGQAGRKIAETVDQACTSGTSFAARIKTLNNKNVPIYGVSLTAR